MYAIITSVFHWSFFVLLCTHMTFQCLGDLTLRFKIKSARWQNFLRMLSIGVDVAVFVFVMSILTWFLTSVVVYAW